MTSRAPKATRSSSPASHYVLGLPLNLVYYPNPVLSKVSEPVDFNTTTLEWLDTFTSNMIHLMLESDGVGLAAPQVGQSIRVMVLDIGRSYPIVAVNPVLTYDSEQPTEEDWEGCLSFPGVAVKRVRHSTAHLSYQTVRGIRSELSLTDFPARVAQHEMDHLDGIHFGTGASWLKRQELAKKVQKSLRR